MPLSCFYPPAVIVTTFYLSISLFGTILGYKVPSWSLASLARCSCFAVLVGCFAAYNKMKLNEVLHYKIADPRSFSPAAKAPVH